MSLHGIMKELADYFLEFGGHEQAAGATLAADRFDAFRAEARAVFSARVPAEALVRTHEAEAELPIEEVGPGIVRRARAARAARRGQSSARLPRARGSRRRPVPAGRRLGPAGPPPGTGAAKRGASRGSRRPVSRPRLARARPFDLQYRLSDDGRGYGLQVEIVSARPTAGSPRLRIRRWTSSCSRAASSLPRCSSFPSAPGRRPDVRPGERADGLASTGRTPDRATTLLDGSTSPNRSAGNRSCASRRTARRLRAGRGPGAPDLYAGEKVTLTVYPDDGAPVTVHSERGEYDERTREALTGNVAGRTSRSRWPRPPRCFFHPWRHDARSTEEGPLHPRLDRPDRSVARDTTCAEKALRFSGPVEGPAAGADSAGLSKLTARPGPLPARIGVLELENVDGSRRRATATPPSG